MANRKSPQLTPVLDNSAASENEELEKSKVIHALDKAQFNSIIRAIRTLPQESIEAIRLPVIAQLQAFDIERDMGDVVPGTPSGSDQFDPGSFITWVKKIKDNDFDSINQLSKIDATIEDRFPTPVEDEESA